MLFVVCVAFFTSVTLAIFGGTSTKFETCNCGSCVGCRLQVLSSAQSTIIDAQPRAISESERGVRTGFEVCHASPAPKPCRYLDPLG